MDLRFRFWGMDEAMRTAESSVSATAAFVVYMNIYVYVLAYLGLKIYNINIQLIFLCFSSFLCHSPPP